MSGSARRRTSTPAKSRAASLLTAVYALSTVVALLVWATTPRPYRPGRIVLLLDTLNLPVGHSLVSVAVTALVTRALIGRKRIGWYAVVAAQALGVYLSVVDLVGLSRAPDWAPWLQPTKLDRLLDVVSLLLTPFVLWWLWRIRAAFPARLQRGSWNAAVATLLGGVAVAIAVAWVLVRLGATTTPTAADQLRAALSISLDWNADATVLVHGLPPWLPEVPEAIVAVSLVAGVVLFLRSARLATEWTGRRELAVRRLLERYGERDSLGYFATRRDKASVFSADRQAVVTYRVINGVSLASGDPIGRPASWSDAVSRWLAQAREYGWVPAVLSASEDGARVYADHGLGVVSLGDEAILDPDEFDLRRLSMSGVRHAVRRATRAGVTCRIRRQDAITSAELAEIWACADAWRGDEPERGFSMALNRQADPADARMLLLTARDGGGSLLGVLSFVPWGRHQVSLDVMRRSPVAPNGVVELMVATMMAEAGRLGVRRVSLNFCMFRRIYADAERLGSGPLTRINYSILGTLDRFWQLERLYVSNQKFEPTWCPRFVCIDDPMSLPQVALAAGMAEGFVPQPRLSGPPRDQRLTEAELAEVAAIDASPTETEAQVSVRGRPTRPATGSTRWRDWLPLGAMPTRPRASSHS